MFKLTPLVRELHNIFKGDSIDEFYDITDQADTKLEIIEQVITNKDEFDFEMFPNKSDADSTEQENDPSSEANFNHNVTGDTLPDKENRNTKYET